MNIAEHPEIYSSENILEEFSLVTGLCWFTFVSYHNPSFLSNSMWSEAQMNNQIEAVAFFCRIVTK